MVIEDVSQGDFLGTTQGTARRPFPALRRRLVTARNLARSRRKLAEQTVAGGKRAAPERDRSCGCRSCFAVMGA